MARPRKSSTLTCSEMAVLAMLAGLFLLGLVAYSRSLTEATVALMFLACVLLIAHLWQLTLRRAKTAAPPGRWQRAWNAGVFVTWLVVMMVLAWWYFADRVERFQQPPPAPNPATLPEDQQEDHQRG